MINGVAKGAVDSHLPLIETGRFMDRLKLRAVLGWSEWKQDVTRHTAASMHLAKTGAVEKTAFALGTSENNLRNHYMALVTKEEAEKFWVLAP